MNSREVSIETARARLGDYVNAASIAESTTIITRNGRPAARIAPLASIVSEGQRQRRAEDMASIRDAARDVDLNTIDIARYIDTDLLEKHFPWLEIFRNCRNNEQEKLDAAGGFNPTMPTFAPDPDGRVQAWQDAYNAAVKAILRSDLW